MPDENSKAKATFWKLRGTHLWGEKNPEPFKEGKFSFSPRLGCSSLLLLPKALRRKMAPGFLLRSQQ